ncbi:MAG: hypothetical protein AAF429_06165 [Pseudomonadota bacterium]
MEGATLHTSRDIFGTKKTMKWFSVGSKLQSNLREAKKIMNDFLPNGDRVFWDQETVSKGYAVMWVNFYKGSLV